MQKKDKETAQTGTRSIIRAFQTFEALCSNVNGVRLTDLQHELKLNKTTLFRILGTLSQLGYAEQDKQTDYYKPTVRLLSLCNSLLAKMPLRNIAMEHIHGLSSKSNMSVHLSILDGNQTVIIDKVEPDSSLRVAFHIGRRANIYSTGTGKIFLANMSDSKIKQFFKENALEPLTDKTIIDKATLLDEIKQVQKLGYAYDDQENNVGVSCIAAPIRDFMGNVVAAVSVTGPSAGIESSRGNLIPLVMDTAKTISGKLGFQNY